MGVELRVLGHCEARVDGRAVDLGHARRVCVLLALLVDANQLISAEQIVDRVWGEYPPRQARNAVQHHLSRLRRILTAGDGGDGVAIIRRSGGYVWPSTRWRWTCTCSSA